MKITSGETPMNTLTTFEKRLWLVSLLVVGVSSVLGGVAALNLAVSLIGVTALIFVAKGHVLGQLLTIVFGLIYGYISYQCAYYGEMITYMGMTVPMAAVAAVAWLKNPYEQGKQEVKVAPFYKKDWALLVALTAVVTFGFYFILAYFQTASLPLSTLSITTSFSASYLTYRRSPYYALAYALNDVVLIGLWVAATWEEPSYFTMVMCFVMFFLNDLYGYYNWRRMERRQGL
ncbi:nicotinamide riboside transporter PnuC [Bengtsoniella intestinalis]|uniref:nicotinamide riboside transporter PnuC n=1 Tax=Bengtsoniella intestinalis TaxID=3073143 RepID=UPI00391F4072